MAAEAGRRAGLPAGLLPAISRIEAGRGKGGERRAWPWTLNHAGKGLYFETRGEALAYLREATAGGRTNIDVGCMQINHYWHGANFPSVESMLDPVVNVDYAVRFLIDLHERHGSWPDAVRNYHSPDPERGARYLAAFARAHDLILEGPEGGSQTALAAAAPATGTPTGLPGGILSGRSGQGGALVRGARLRGDPVHDVHALAEALNDLADERGAPVLDLRTWRDFAQADLRRLSPRVRHRTAEVAAFRAELARGAASETP
jgi:hypothetical protein